MLEACFVVGLPPLPTVEITPAALNSDNGLSEQQALLDALLDRHDQLVVLADRVNRPSRLLSVTEQVALGHAIGGCLEAARGAAVHLRGQMTACLQRQWEASDD